MWKILILASLPLITPIAVYFLSKSKVKKEETEGSIAPISLPKCPYCHKVQQIDVQGEVDCEQCNTTLKIKPDLTLEIAPGAVKRADIFRILAVVFGIVLAALLPVYYWLSSGLKYGERNIMVFLMLLSLGMAKSGLKDGVVGARFGRIYKAESPVVFYMVVFVWAAFSVACAGAFAYDVMTNGQW